MDRNQNGVIQVLVQVKRFQMDRNHNGLRQALLREYPGIECVSLCLIGHNMCFVVPKRNFGGVCVLLFKNSKSEEVCA